MKKEMKICGRAACEAVFKNRPQAVVRAWVSEQQSSKFKKYLAVMARNKRGYKITDQSELEKVSSSSHHEGICLLVKMPESPQLSVLLEKIKKKRSSVLLLLENVGNPHNLGAIARVAAHFGVDALIASGSQSAGLSAAACRNAEGGLEVLPFCRDDDLEGVVSLCRKGGYVPVATSSHNSKSLYEADLPKKILLMMGAEGEGLSSLAEKSAQLRLALPGTGAVESLNVATATSAILGELWRRSQ